MSQIVHPRAVRSHAPRAVTSQHQEHVVSCPYEPIGFAIVTLPVKPDGSVDIPLNEPLRCNCCKQHFRLGTKVSLVGVPVDQPIGAPIGLKDQH